MRLAAVSLLLIGLAVAGICQNVSRERRQDSIQIKRMTIQGPEFSLGHRTLLLPSSPENDELLRENPTAALRNALVRSPEFNRPNPEGQPDIASSLRLSRNDDLKFLRSLLTSVQAGGAAYLAYRHIKKYGLFR